MDADAFAPETKMGMPPRFHGWSLLLFTLLGVVPAVVQMALPGIPTETAAGEVLTALWWLLTAPVACLSEFCGIRGEWPNILLMAGQWLVYALIIGLSFPHRKKVLVVLAVLHLVTVPVGWYYFAAAYGV